MEAAYIFLVTKIASTEGFVIACVLIGILLLSRARIRETIVFTLPAVGLALSTGALKEAFRIPRPETPRIETDGFAFPSGHASGSMFLALTVCYFARNLPNPWRYTIYVLAIGFSLAIGVSRVDLGVHTPLQVLAGFVLGIFWAILFIALMRRR